MIEGVKRVGVVGAGAIGGIAQVFATASSKTGRGFFSYGVAA
jgi:hypothetical protein